MIRLSRVVRNNASGHSFVSGFLVGKGCHPGMKAGASHLRLHGLAAAILLALPAAQAWVSDGVCVDPDFLPVIVVVGTTPGTGFEVACGDGALAGGFNAIAFGYRAQATGTSAVAIGDQALSSGMHSVAVGSLSEATGGTSSTAIGYHSIARADASTAVGSNNTVNGFDSSALGASNTVNGYGSHAVGWNNTVGANYAYVLGDRITVPSGMDEAVVLGSFSAVSPAVPVSSGVVGGITYSGYAGSPTIPGSIFSIGRDGAERQIQHVAAGQVTATSTDGINGSQLYATQAVIDDVAQTTAANFGGGVAVNPEGSLTAPAYVIGGTSYTNVGGALAALDAAQIHYVSVDDDGLVQANFANDAALGANSIAIGAGASTDAAAPDGVAIGHSASVGPGASRGVAVGAQSSAMADHSIAIGGATARNSYATAIGDIADAGGEFRVAIGNGATATGHRSIATGKGAVAQGGAVHRYGLWKRSDRAVQSGPRGFLVGAQSGCDRVGPSHVCVWGAIDRYRRPKYVERRQLERLGQWQHPQWQRVACIR